MPLTRPARLLALALLAACSLAFAPAPVYREPKAKPDRRTDEEKLQGTWELVSGSVDGRHEPGKPDEFAVFAGRDVEFRTGEEAAGWSFALNPTASPKRINLLTGEETFLRGIYRLEGDRLTLAHSSRTGPAVPADFKGGKGFCVTVFRRAKRGK